MNIVIFTIGTRGDVQPYVALGWGGLDPKQFYDDLPENIHIIKSAPHSKIFPLMAGLFIMAGLAALARPY